MEWYYWVIALGSIGLGGFLGALLDIKYDLGVRGVYWFLGALSVAPAVIVMGWAMN